MIEAKEAIRQTASITSVIETYTRVKGNKALCPFHPDTNPSLSISDAKGLWHCFVCGAGGDIFTFVMKAEEVPFPEAVKILCGRYGIPYVCNTPQQAAEAKRQIDFQRSAILALKQKHEEELAPLKESDQSLGALWKKIYRSNSARMAMILEAVEECFIILEEEFKQAERRYQDEKRKMYRKASNQVS